MTADRWANEKRIHYVYYVSDMPDASQTGYVYKMDAGREIAGHICRELGKCRMEKYTEYDGNTLHAASVGIVFPTHMWGCSLAVYSFLKHLRVTEDTYVYAVAVGESLSGDVTSTRTSRICSLNEFRKIFVREHLGDEEDIFVRCIDRSNIHNDTETLWVDERVRNKNLVRQTLGPLLYHDMRSLSEEAEESYPEKKDSADRKISLGNIFLDEDIMSGVRLCRVM